MTIGAMEGNMRTVGGGHHSSVDHHQADSPSRSCSLCVGCGGVITDPYILRVQPDLEWHARCLKCVECAAELNEARTCYVRDGKPYCKADYCRLFANRCAKCDGPFAKTEFVMRARSKVYHIDCFRCYTCSRQLIPGEEFAVKNDNLFCRADFDALEILRKSPASPNLMGVSGCELELGPPGGNSTGNSSGNNNNNNNNSNNNNNNSSKVLNNNNIHDQDMDSRDDADDDSLSPSANSETQSNCGRSSVGVGGGGSVGGVLGGGGGLMKLSSSGKRKGSGKDSKTTRVRTVLNEKQLHTLRTCYAANPRPDALMKEQLVEMTGLSPRVIRVWFQNKRCKDKKKQILIKQMEHQQQKRTLNGVPMIASSPVRHEPAHLGGPGSGAQPLDVQSYASPWGPPMHGGAGEPPHLADPTHPHLHPPQGSLPPPPPPPFQQLVCAYHSLYPSDEEDDTCVSLPTDPDACMYAAAAATRQPL